MFPIVMFILKSVYDLQNIFQFLKKRYSFVISFENIKINRIFMTFH